MWKHFVNIITKYKEHATYMKQDLKDVGVTQN